MRHLRPYLVMVVAFAAVMWACSCAPPPDPGIHGRQAFDAWLIANGVRQENGDLSGFPDPITGKAPCGAYMIAAKLAVTDQECINRATTDPEAKVWIPVHEAGHAVDRALVFPQGGDAAGVERGAQCVAEVVLGFSYSPWIGSTSYWDCPADQVDRTRILMEAIGAW